MGRLGLSPAIRFGPTPLAEEAEAAFDPATLWAGTETGLWYDPDDLSTLFQDAAGTTPVTTVGQVVQRMTDKSGNGNHAISAPGIAPTYQVDGNGRGYLNFTTGTGFSVATISLSAAMNLFVALKRDAGDTGWVTAYDTTTGSMFVATAQSAAGTATHSSAGTPTTYVDGVVVTTRGELYTALASTETSTIEVRTANMSAWPSIGFFRYSAFDFVGTCHGIILAPDLSADNRTSVQEYLTV